jgi:pentatricopeptide repeat protein
MEEDGCPPNEWSYNVIIRGFLRHRDESRAVQLIGEMRDRGCGDHSLVEDLLSNGRQCCSEEVSRLT